MNSTCDIVIKLPLTAGSAFSQGLCSHDQVALAYGDGQDPHRDTVAMARPHLGTWLSLHIKLDCQGFSRPVVLGLIWGLAVHVSHRQCAGHPYHMGSAVSLQGAVLGRTHKVVAMPSQQAVLLRWFIDTAVCAVLAHVLAMRTSDHTQPPASSLPAPAEVWTTSATHIPSA